MSTQDTNGDPTTPVEAAYHALLAMDHPVSALSGEVLIRMLRQDGYDITPVPTPTDPTPRTAATARDALVDYLASEPWDTTTDLFREWMSTRLDNLIALAAAEAPAETCCDGLHLRPGSHTAATAREALARLHVRGDYTEEGWYDSVDGLECRVCGKWCDTPTRLDHLIALAREDGWRLGWEAGRVADLAAAEAPGRVAALEAALEKVATMADEWYDRGVALGASEWRQGLALIGTHATLSVARPAPASPTGVSGEVCAVCGNPTVMGEGLIRWNGGYVHQTCYMTLAPAPTPSEPVGRCGWCGGSGRIVSGSKVCPTCGGTGKHTPATRDE